MTTLTYTGRITECSDAEMLAWGHDAAAALWNSALYLHNQISRVAYEELGKNHHSSNYDLDRMMRRLRAPEFYALHDRIAGATLKELDGAWKSFFTHRRNGDKRAKPPRYRKDKGERTPAPLFFDRRNLRVVDEGRLRLKLNRVRGEYLYIEFKADPRLDVDRIKTLRVLPDGALRFTVEIAPAESAGRGVAALDLGIVNLGAMVIAGEAEAHLFSGRGLLSEEYYFQTRLNRTKPAGYDGHNNPHKRSRRALRLQHKRSARRNLIIHNFTRRIIDLCVAHGVGTLIVGDLKGIMKQPDGAPRDFRRRDKGKMFAWSYDKISQQLVYKGATEGVTVIKISERDTSRTCSHCGLVRKANLVARGLYRCRECGAVYNADINEARNILFKGISETAPAEVGVTGSLLPLPSLALADIRTTLRGTTGTALAVWRFVNQQGFSCKNRFADFHT